MVLSHILQGQCYAVARKGYQGGIEGHVDIDVIAHGTVVARWCSGAIDGVLDFIVLHMSSCVSQTVVNTCLVEGGRQAAPTLNQSRSIASGHP